jgi:hypothetical protein
VTADEPLRFLRSLRNEILISKLDINEPLTPVLAKLPERAVLETDMVFE